MAERFDMSGRNAGAVQNACALETGASGTSTRTSGLLKITTVAFLGLALANCASQERSAKVDPKYGVAPSPMVVSDGSEIPRGGGREMVGRPYTIAGRTYTPRRDDNYSREGLASWYGPGFHGRQTANGEVFDKYAVSAAHPTLPIPSYVRVTNLSNSRSLIVRVNDRGPFHGNRIIDVSKTVADALDFRSNGVARVKVDYVAPASTDGSDDQILIATLRDDGRLAQLPDHDTRPGVMVASADPAPASQPQAVQQQVAQTPVAAASLPASQASNASFASVQPLAINGRFGQQPRMAAPRTSSGGSVLAGLFFAEPAGAAQNLSRDSAFGGLATLNQQSLRRAP
jgi:rare lipoprotein A